MTDAVVDERWARLHLDALRCKLDHEHPEYAS